MDLYTFIHDYPDVFHTQILKKLCYDDWCAMSTTSKHLKDIVKSNPCKKPFIGNQVREYYLQNGMASNLEMGNYILHATIEGCEDIAMDLLIEHPEAEFDICELMLHAAESGLLEFMKVIYKKNETQYRRLLLPEELPSDAKYGKAYYKLTEIVFTAIDAENLDIIKWLVPLFLGRTIGDENAKSKSQYSFMDIDFITQFSMRATEFLGKDNVKYFLSLGAIKEEYTSYLAAGSFRNGRLEFLMFLSKQGFPMNIEFQEHITRMLHFGERETEDLSLWVKTNLPIQLSN